MTEQRLRWGYHAGLPAEAGTAWGCRAIIDRHGWVDVLWDRSDIIGEHSDRLAALLAERYGLQWRAEVTLMLRDGRLSTREDREVILVDDEVIVKANPMRSAGYLYVVAYLRQDAEDRGRG